MRSYLPYLSLALALTCAPALALAEASEDELVPIARAHDERAAELFAAERYQQALAQLIAAQEVLPASTRLYNIATCHDRLGNREEAIATYREYVGADGARADRRVQAVDRIAALQSELDRSPDEPSTPPAPEPEPEGRQRLSRAPFFATLGVTAALGLTAIILGAVSISWDNEYEALQLPADIGRAEELESSGPAISKAADVMIGLSAASAIATIVLAIFTRWREEPSSSTALLLQPSPSGLSLGLSRSF